MFAHLLFGTSYLDHGNLRFEARIAGTRGQKVKLEILAIPLDEEEEVIGIPGVTVESSISDPERFGIGTGIISISIIDGVTTESQLINLCRASRAFNNICRVDIRKDQAGVPIANGSGIVALLALTALNAPLMGILQFLESRFAILGWNDRELVAKDQAVGLLFPYEEQPEKKERFRGAEEEHLGWFQVGIAFQTKHTGEEANRLAFVEQTCMLDLFREQLYFAIKQFSHPRLSGQIGGDDGHPEKFGYQNTLKDETEGTMLENARLRVVGSFRMHYKHPPNEFTDLTTYADTFTGRIAFWREPIDDPLGGQGHGGEALDATVDFPQSD